MCSRVPVITLLMKPALSLDTLHHCGRENPPQSARRGAWAAAAEENGSGQTVGPGGLAVRPMPRGSLPLPATSSRQGHGGQVCVLHCPVPRPSSVGVGRGTGRPGQGPAPPLRLLPAGRRAEQRREACGLEWVSLPRRPAGLATPPTWSCGLLGLPQGGPVPLGSARHGHSALPGQHVVCPDQGMAAV